jgi:hypothetical protein
LPIIVAWDRNAQRVAAAAADGDTGVGATFTVMF